MPQISAALTINNGAATPVAKTFAPERVAPELSSFTERSASSSLAFPRITVKFSPANAGRRTNRVDYEIDLPKTQDVGGVATLAATGRFKGYFVVPDTFTAENRADLHAYVVNALSNTVLRAPARDLDPLY